MLPILQRTLLFIVPFTAIFWYIHTQFGSPVSLSTQGGLIGLYSTAAFIFTLIVAFVIQREWEMWANLSVSVRTEIDAVRELWKWSSLTDASLRDAVHAHLESYLRLIVSEWRKGGETKRSDSVDVELDNMRALLVHRTLSLEGLGSQMRIALNELIRARNQRLNFSSEHIPGILKRIVILADWLLIILSLFIEMNNVYLDYAFTASIGLLAFALILVVDDLDNPFRPGTWHLTTEGYETLLNELTEKENQSS